MLPVHAWEIIHSVPELGSISESKTSIVMSLNVDNDVQRKILKEISKQCKKLLQHSQCVVHLK